MPGCPFWRCSSWRQVRLPTTVVRLTAALIPCLPFGQGVSRALLWTATCSRGRNRTYVPNYTAYWNQNPATKANKVNSGIIDIRTEIQYHGNMNTKGSILNDYNAVFEAASTATSIKDALNKLGLRAAGGNYKAFRAACEAHNISVPLFDRTSQLKSIRFDKIPDSEVFVENSTYHNRSLVKKRLYVLGVPEECSECGQGPVWNGKPLVLTLEHINGVWNDNRRENLTILCGHCHSQTETFCGKSKPRKEKVYTPRKTKIIWPELQELQKMIDDLNYVQTAKTLGVSDVAVRKRLKSLLSESN